ncbi:Carbonic anhydrase [Smittium mucronatum]|uniref:Carbonic anhydrase n=1 Tax=Smittium mucronatum TaxID=133383 RepID=A0A1R0GV53_9FUNG|nr:Carbonic anhydrase [Smittium mucronatum]
MTYSKEVFRKNEEWAKKTANLREDFFKELSHGQKPDLLWIGCSDSRVSSSTIAGSELGQIFTLRNIANCIAPDDINSMSVIQYAVHALGVKEIAVVGHTNCGGIKASKDIHDLSGPIKHWLEPVHQLYLENLDEINVIEGENNKLNHLCELNVKRVADIVSKLEWVVAAKNSGNPVHIHGWIFNLEDGTLKDLKL